MSVFVDKLKSLSEGEHQPIGFGARQTASSGLKILLVAQLSQEAAEGTSDNLVGADAVLLGVSRAGTVAESLKKVSGSLSDIPCGMWLQGGGKTRIKQIAKTESDFIVFPVADTPISMIEDTKAGKIIEVEASVDGGLLRTVNTLPVDAVLVAGEEKKEDVLTWQQLMVFQRFADILTKPLLVPVPAKVTGKELLSLWEAGVSGVVVEADGQDRITKLRQEIDKLDFPSQRRRDKSEAVLPRTGRETSRAAIEEEDEDY
ncbi:hypothetical protein ACFLYN_00260 [Chloroflexota bacterium]